MASVKKCDESRARNEVERKMTRRAITTELAEKEKKSDGPKTQADKKEAVFHPPRTKHAYFLLLGVLHLPLAMPRASSALCDRVRASFYANEWDRTISHARQCPNQSACSKPCTNTWLVGPFDPLTFGAVAFGSLNGAVCGCVRALCTLALAEADGHRSQCTVFIERR